MKRPPAFLEIGLWPLALIYRSVVAVRNRDFDRGTRAVLSAGRPVLSVGNLTSGGTGKTPLVSLLVETLVNRGRSVGIVSRGYGGKEKGPALVATDGGAATAARFGDEPAWLAHRHPQVPVAIGGDRVAAARALEAANVDVIIADDGFQHRRLGRAFDLVILDASEPRWHYRPLPLGRMREPFAALARAGAVCITKTNLANPAATAWLREEIARAGLRPVFEFESRIRSVTRLGETQAVPVERWAQTGGAFLVSGIGNPAAFRELAGRDLFGRDFAGPSGGPGSGPGDVPSGAPAIVGHLTFNDHHTYREADLARIAREARAAGASFVLTTEKDAIKVGVLWKNEFPCWVTRLETIPRTDLKELYAAIDRALF